MLSPLNISILGACAGSFLNVCLFRWKCGGQIVTPSSYCPHCKCNIHWYDNLPVIGFFLLGGRCRFCGVRISSHYPMVELFSAISFGVLAFNFSGLFLLFSKLLFLSFLILLGISDIKWRLLPHLFNNLFILVGLIFSFWTMPFFQRVFFCAWSLILIDFIPFLFVQFFPKSLGGGDIKMLGALALWNGPRTTILLLMISSLLALTVFVCLMIFGKVSRHWKIPFGFFLTLSSFIPLFFPDFFNNLKVAL